MADAGRGGEALLDPTRRARRRSPRRSAFTRAVALVVLVAGMSACGDELDDRILAIEATGTVIGLGFVDMDGDSARSGPDRPAEGFEIGVAFRGTNEVVAAASIDASGVFRLGEVPVGRHRIVLDRSYLGDSLNVVRLDSAVFTLVADDTAEVELGIAVPHLSVAEARTAAPGVAGFVDGIVLGLHQESAGGTVHVRGGDHAMPVVRLGRPNLLPGDSIRVRGRTSRRAGQPVIEASGVFLVETGVRLPEARRLSTGAAARASDGLRDADLIEVRDAVVTDTTFEDGNLVAFVDGGSGSLRVRIRPSIGIPFAAIQPDSVVFDRARGLLIPVAPAVGGSEPTWELLPRFGSDVSASRVESTNTPVAGVGATPPNPGRPTHDLHR